MSQFRDYEIITETVYNINCACGGMGDENGLYGSNILSRPQPFILPPISEGKSKIIYSPILFLLGGDTTWRYYRGK